MSFRSAIQTTFRRCLHDSVFALQFFNVVRFAAFFLVSILLVRIPLSVDQIATYEYVLFLSSIVTGWWIHGFIQGFMADEGQAGETQRGVLFRNYSRLFLIFGGGIMALFSATIEGLAYFDVLTDPPAGFYYFLIFHFLLQAIILMVYYCHQKGWKTRIYLFSCYLFLVYTGSFLLLLQDGYALNHVYRYLAIFTVPVLLVWTYFYWKSGNVKSSLRLLRHFPHLSTLMLIQGIGFISLWSDGFWVQYFYGTDELFAFFRYGGREFPFFVILTVTFSTAMIHEGSSRKGLRRIWKGSRRFIRLFMPLGVILLLSSQHLFAWVYSDEFVPASFIFDMYLLLIVVRVLFPRPILISHRLFRSLLWVSVGELVINVVVSFMLYWPLGIFGLILGSLVAHLFELGASLFLVHRKLNIEIRKYVPVRLYAAFTIGLVLVFVIKYGFFSTDWMELMISP